MTMGRVALAVCVGAASVVAGGALAACPDLPPPTPQTQVQQTQFQFQQAKKSAKNPPCVSLSALPQISAQVVATAPAPAAKQPTYEGLPQAAPYQGPQLGLTKPDPGVKPVPTVGFHWSLE
jgi:hypothetical protein